MCSESPQSFLLASGDSVLPVKEFLGSRPNCMLVAEQIELEVRAVLGRFGNREGLVVIGETARHLRGSKWEGRVSSKGVHEGRDLDSSQSLGST